MILICACFSSLCVILVKVCLPSCVLQARVHILCLGYGSVPCQGHSTVEVQLCDLRFSSLRQAMVRMQRAYAHAIAAAHLPVCLVDTVSINLLAAVNMCARFLLC